MPLRPVRIPLTAVDRFTKPIEAFRSKIRSVSAPVHQLRRSLRGLSQDSGLTRLGSAIGSVARKVALLGVAGAGLAVAGFKKFLDAGSELGDTAAKLGIGIEALQELRFAADQSGVSVGALDTSLLQLQRRSAEVAAGKKGDHASAFKALGIAVKDANGKLRPAEELLEAIEAGLERVREPAQRTRIAMALFGKSGATMLQIIGDGAGELAKMRREARDLGIIMDEKTALGAKEAGDQLAKLRSVVKGVAFQIAGALLPDVLKVTRAGVAWAIANRELIRTRVLEFSKDLVATLRETVRVVGAVVSGVKRVVDLFGATGTAAGVLGAILGLKLLGVVLNLAVAMKALGVTSAIALLPFVKFIAIAVAIGAVVTGLVWIVKHRKEVLEFFAGLLAKASAFVGGIVERIDKAIGEVIAEVTAAFAKIEGMIPDFLKGGGLASVLAGLQAPGLAAAGGAGGGQFGGHITVELKGDQAQGARVRRLESSRDLDLSVMTGLAHLGG